VNEELLQRLRDINPEPSTQEDTDELAAVFATIDARRSVMSTEEKTATTAENRQQSWRRGAMAFIGAMVIVLLIVGGSVLLLGRSVEQVAGDEPTSEAPPTTQASEASPPATEAPSVTTVAPAMLPYDEVLDGSAAALFTSMALASDGSPVMVSLVSDADVVGSYEETTISVIRLVRCLDPQCAEPPSIVDLEDVDVVAWTNGKVHLALDPFDRPVILHPSEDGPKMAFCDDPMCTSFETRLVDEATQWGFGVFGDWAFAPNGNPVYPSLVPDGLDLVACLDRFCDATSSTRIDTGFFISSWQARVAADGSILLVYVIEEPIGPPDPETGYDGGKNLRGTQKVAWCADAVCSDGPVITTIDEGTAVGGGYPVNGKAGIEIWYTSRWEPSEGTRVNLVDTKATCLNEACTEFELSYVGPQDFWDGTDAWVQAEVVAPDDSRLELRTEFDGGGSPLVLARYSETGGGTWTYTTLATAECNNSFHGGYCEESYKADLAIGGDGLPIVVYGDDAGVHLIRCPDLVCAPPEDE
jgi:hypothetical protein